MKVYTTFIHSASITRGVTYAKLTHTVAEGRYTTAPYSFPAADRTVTSQASESESRPQFPIYLFIYL